MSKSFAERIRKGPESFAMSLIRFQQKKTTQHKTFRQKKDVFWDCFWSKKEYIVSPEKKFFETVFGRKKDISFRQKKSSLRLFLVEKRIYYFARTKKLFDALLLPFVKQIVCFH